MTRTWTRWVPAALVPVVVAAGALVGAAQAGAAPDLPARSAEQVLAMVGEADVQALSGTLEQSSKLGLPQLPTGGPGASSGAASVLDLLTGSHTARVYLDGPTSARLQVMDTLGERDVVRHGDDLWFYDYQSNAATHATLPPGAAREPAIAGGDLPTPAEVAHRLLAAIDPSTRLTVESDTMVAGRPAYSLVITPRSDDTLIGSVSIAVDAETGLPLRVQVQARGQDKPAFRLAFTAISLRTPSAERFQFVPPAGATVTELTLPAEHEMAPMDRADPTARDGSRATAGQRPTVSGSGWDAVVELPAGAAPSEVRGSPLLAQLTRAVPGGRLLHTALVNVLLTSDGRVLVGSVPLERLQAAAAGT